MCLPGNQGSTGIRCAGCDAKIVRATACMHLVCTVCGFNSCARCNYSVYKEKGSANALVDHYGAAYLGRCSQFPAGSSLFWNGRPLDMPYACVEVSDAELKAGTREGGCRSASHDCCDPTHHIWQEMLSNNRRARQAVRCVNHLRGTAFFVPARDALLKRRNLMSFTQKSLLY